MTKEQQQTIERLRNMGLGYRKIGIALDLQGTKSGIIAKQMAWMDMQKKRIEPEKESKWKQFAQTVCDDNVASL